VNVRWSKAASFILPVVLTLSTCTAAMAGLPPGENPFQVTYFDVATSAASSRAGYGGPGISGGSGDNTVRIINSQAKFGTLCAMIYVFDDFEELQTCCGCPVSPDGLRTLSVVNDLTLDFGVNKGNLNAGVIRIVTESPNFIPGNPNPSGTNPPGVNGPNTGTVPVACDPTGGLGNDPFHRGSLGSLAPGLKAYITHAELVEPGNIPGGHSVQSTSVEEFLAATPEEIEEEGDRERCAFLLTNGSGSGVCTCGVGDSEFVASPNL